MFVHIRNGWYQDYYVHAENGTLTAGPIQLEWRGAMWLIEPVEGADAFRFRNVRWADQYLHTEYGAVQVGAIDPQWESAMWTIE